MKVTDKKLFVSGFWDGFYGNGCVFGTEGAYCAGFVEGAKLNGVVSEDEVISLFNMEQ